MLQARSLVFMGGLTMITLLLFATAALDRLGANLMEALYLAVLGLTLIGYGVVEWRGR